MIRINIGYNYRRGGGMILSYSPTQTYFRALPGLLLHMGILSPHRIFEAHSDRTTKQATSNEEEEGYFCMVYSRGTRSH